MACLQFEQLGLDRVAVPTVSYVDHNVLQFDNKNPEDHAYLRSWAARYGALYSRPGNGIAHYLHLERFARPGRVLRRRGQPHDDGRRARHARDRRGRDRGRGRDGRAAVPGRAAARRRRRAPRARCRPWVQSKDVVLELLRRRGVRGGRGRIFEFHGEGVATLSATDRGTICNMVMETGATTGIFPSDERTRGVARRPGPGGASSLELAADPGAVYDETETIDLGELEPLIALPSSPGNVVPVREAAGTATRQVCVGSSVNSSFEDLAIVAAVLRGRSVHAGARPHRHAGLAADPRHDRPQPASTRTCSRAGARMLEPACGPCIGMGQAPAAGAVSVRTFNRNFPGRSGTPGDRVYLCSPATAAATALRGEIADPRELGEPPVLDAAARRPRARRPPDRPPAGRRARDRAREGREHRPAARAVPPLPESDRAAAC